MLVLGRGDQSNVTEHLCGERLIRVVAQVRGSEVDAREIACAFLQVHGLFPVDRLLDDYRRRRVAAALLQLADHLRDRHVDDLREALQLFQSRGPLLGEIGRPELNRGCRAIVDDRPALAVEHRPSRGLERDRAELVVHRGVQILRPGEHLQRPEPEEEDAEDRDRDAAQNRDPQRDLRGQPERLGHSGRRWHEGARPRAVRGGAPAPPGADAGASQAAAPPRARSAAGGRDAGRAHRRAASGSG